MSKGDLIARLRALAVERRPEACFGCGMEHNCSIHGCSVILEAADRLTKYAGAERDGRLKSGKATLDEQREPVALALSSLRAQQEPENTKTSDVAPVRHGRWIEHKHFHHDHYIDSTYECSECKVEEPSTSDYCPNCGAKMDGGVNRETD